MPIDPRRSRVREVMGFVLLRDTFWMASPWRRAGRLGMFAVYAYGAILLFLLALENHFLFGPGDSEWNTPPPYLAMRDVELTSPDGGTIHAWWTAPPGWTPDRGAILLSHGNGGNLSHRWPLMERWRKELGRAVFAYDYPGYGRSTGRPSEAGCYAAAEAAYRWLVEGQRVSEREVILVGESLGGAMAIDLATRHPCRLVVTCSTFTSFPDMAQQRFPWLPGRYLVRNSLDNLAKIGTLTCPVFIVHGTADTLIPHWMGERLRDASGGPTRFVSLPGVPHVHPDQAEFYAAVRAFLDETAPTSLGAKPMLPALENYLLFPGARDREWLEPPPRLRVRDVELSSADGNKIHAWWTVPEGWTPQRGAIHYSHGNGGNLSHRWPTMERWRKELGRAVLIYDYPGYGKSTGRPTEAGCYAAAEAAYRWLVEEQRVPPKEVILLGSSLGGAMAIELASRHPCRVVVSCSTFTSFPDMAQLQFPLLPARWMVRTRLDNLAKVAKLSCPVFLVHGTADTLIPHGMGERLYSAANEPKRFVSLPGHPHAHPDQPEVYESVRAFLAETAGK
ncbi:MAG: alpha/beta hydrolase [Gemmataceae bacterium]